MDQATEEPGPPNDSVLVFTLAFNGYDRLYGSCIKSQRDYASRHGYHYALLNQPRWTSLTREAAWAKIWLIRKALLDGWGWVVFIDCDAAPQPDAPPVQSLEEPGKDLFLAPGFSGRVNSGVMILKNSAGTLQFIEDIIENCEKPVPKEDALSWGENGHVIHYSKKHSGLKLLHHRWNNNRDPELDDYIRHYSNGPMRPHFKPSSFEQMSFKLESKLAKAYGRLQRRFAGVKDNQNDLATRVEAFAKQCDRSLKKPGKQNGSEDKG